MARGFNLTAEINLRGPSNLRQVVSNLRRQLGSINTNVNVQINQQTSRQITVVNRSFQDFNRTLQQTRNIADATARSINQLGNAARTLSTNLQNIPQTINQVAQGANQAAQANNRAAAATRGATSEFAEFGRQSALAVRRFAAFATVTGVIYKASNAITNATKDFIDFNQQLIKVAQVTDTPVKSLDFLVSNITRLSTGLGVASQDLITVSQTLAQAGLNARDTSIALQALARSALAPSFDNLNNTVEGSIALMRQFGISAGQLEGALGSINAVAAKFAVEAGDIVTAISRTGGVFAAASKGVSQGTDALNEFIAVFTSVRATTRESAETIATGLRTIFTRIQRGETIDALKAYGVALTDLEGKFVGPYEATRRLAEGLSRLDPRDIRFSRIVEELGGFRQIGKVIPLIQQFATAQDALRVAQQGQGSLAKDAATAQLSLANQIAKVREEFTALVRSIGQSQGFQDLVRLGLDLASAFIKVADAVKGALPALTAIFAIKGFQALTQFSRGFAGSLRTGGGQGLSTGGYVHRFASGGVVPGSGRGDKVPALLEPGEVVMSNRAVGKYGRGNLVRMNKYAKGGRLSRVKNKGARDGDSWHIDYEPAADVVGGVTTRAIDYDAYEIDKGKRWEKALGTIATKVADAAYKRSDLTNTGSFYEGFQTNRVKGKYSIGSRPTHEISSGLKNSLIALGVAKEAKKDNTATGSTEQPTPLQIQTLKDYGYNYNTKTRQTKSLTKKNLGGLIQKFVGGGTVEEIASAKGISIQQAILQQLQALGGGAGIRQILGSSANSPIARKALRKEAIESGRYIKESTDFINKALAAKGGGDAAEQARISKLSKVAIAGLLPIGYSKDFEWQLGENTTVYAHVRGLASRYEEAIAKMQQRTSAAASEFAEEMQYADIFGPGTPLAFDFDETLVSGTDILDKTGKPDIPRYSDRPTVEQYLTRGRPTRLLSKLKTLIDADPEFIKKTRILTARPQSTVDLLAKSLQSFGLPYTAQDITGVGGLGANVAKGKAANLGQLEKLIDDNLENVKAAQAAGKQAFLYTEPKRVPALDEIMGQGNIEGAVIEKALAELGANLPPIATLEANRSIDFPSGLGRAAQFFDIDPNIPTEVKRTLDRSSFEKARAEFARYFTEGAGQFSVGGLVQAFANGSPYGVKDRSTKNIRRGAYGQRGFVPLNSREYEAFADQAYVQAGPYGGPGWGKVSGVPMPKVLADYAEKINRYVFETGGAGLSIGKKLVKIPDDIDPEALEALKEDLIRQYDGWYSQIEEVLPFGKSVAAQSSTTASAKDARVRAAMMAEAGNKSYTQAEDAIATFKKTGTLAPFDPAIDSHIKRSFPAYISELESSLKSETDSDEKASIQRRLKKAQSAWPDYQALLSGTPVANQGRITALSETLNTLLERYGSPVSSGEVDNIIKAMGSKLLRKNSGGLIPRFVKGGIADYYSLEKTSGLSSREFDSMVSFAKTNNFSLDEFRSYLKKRAAAQKSRVGSVIDPKSLQSFLMHGAVGPRLGTGDLTEEQKKLAEMLKEPPDPQYNPGRFAGGGTVPALVSNGEAYVPPKLAKSIGYGKLNRMNQADRNGMGRFAKGGISVFKGPGSGTSDSIPTNLPVGSFILREKATKALGLNKGGAVGYIQRFNNGGGAESRYSAGFIGSGGLDADQSFIPLNMLANQANSLAQAGRAQQAAAQTQMNAAQQQQQAANTTETEQTERRGSRFNLSNLGTALAFTGPMLAQQIGQGIGGTTGAGVGGAATAFSSTLAVGAQFGVIGTFVGALAGGVAAIDGYNSAVAQKESELAGIDIDKTLEQSVQTRERFAKTGKAEDASQLVSNFQKIQELEQKRSEANIRAERPGYLSSALSTVSFGYLGGDRRSEQEISGARTAEQQVGAQEAQAFISSMITAGKSYDQVTAILQQKGAAMSDLITAIAEADPAYQADVVAIQKSEMAEELKTRRIAEVRQKYVDQARSLTAAQFADVARAKASQKLAQQINIVSASITKTFDNLNQAINASSNNLKQASEELQRKISGGTGFTASLDALNVLQNPRAFGRAEQNVAIGQASQFAGRDRGFVEQLARFSLDAEDIVASGAARAQQAGVSQGVVAQNITAQLTQRLDAIFGQNTIGDELRKQLTENITEALKRGDEIDIQKLLEESGLSGQLQASKQAFDALQNSLKFVQEAMSFAANAANEYGKLQQNLRENQANYQNTIVQSNIALKEALGQRVGVDERIQARRNVAATRAGVAPAQFNATELAGRRDVLQKEVEAVRSALNKTANSFDSTIPNTSAKFLALTKRLAETENALKATEQSLESLPSIIEGNINDIIGEIGRIQQEMSSRQQAAGSFAEQLVGSTPQEMVELNSTFNLLNNTLNGQITTINQSQAAQQAYFQALQNGSTQQEAYAAAQQAFAGQTKSALGLFSQLTQLSGLEGAEINTIRADLLEGFARAQGMGLQNNPMFQKMIELLRKPPEQSAEIQALQGMLRAQQAELATTTQKINEGVLAKQKDILDSANQQFIKALQDVRVKFDVEQLRNVGLGLGTPGQATNAPRLNRGGVVYASDGTYVNYQPRGTDTVPAMLTPGEFVVNARAAKNNLGLLRNINSTGSGKTYSRGGVVYAAGGYLGSLGFNSWDDFANAQVAAEATEAATASAKTGTGEYFPRLTKLFAKLRLPKAGIKQLLSSMMSGTGSMLGNIGRTDITKMGAQLGGSIRSGGFSLLENLAEMVGGGLQLAKMDIQDVVAVASGNIDDLGGLLRGGRGALRLVGRAWGPTLGVAFGAMEDPNKTGRSRTVNAAFGALGAGSTTMGDVGATSITGSQMGGNLLQAGLTTAQYMAYGAPPPIAALLAAGTLTTQEVAGYMGDVDNTQASEVRLKQQSTAQRNRGRTLDTTNMSSAERRAIQIVEQQGGIERLEGFNATERGWIGEKAKLDNSISLIDANGDGRADIAKNQTRLDELKRRREEHNATQKTIFSESKFGWFGENQTETKTQAEIDKAVKQEAAYQTRAKRARAQVAREDEARADAREQAKLDNEARIEEARQLGLDDNASWSDVVQERVNKLNADRRAKQEKEEQDRQDRATAVGLKPNASIKDIEREETRRKAIANQQLGLSVTASKDEISLRKEQQKQYQLQYGGLNDAADIAITSANTLPPNAYSKEWKSAVDRRKELYAEINSMRTQIRDPNDPFFASQEEFENYRKERLDSLYGDLGATNTIINQEHKAKGYHELSFADKRERWDEYRSGQEKEAKVQKREEIKARNRAAKQQADQMRALAKYANVQVPDKFSNPGAFFNWRKNLQKRIQKDIPFGSRTPEAMNALGIPSDVVNALYQPFSNEQLTSIYSSMLDSGRLSPSASRIVGALRLQKYNLAKKVESDPRLQQIISSASPSEQKAITREFETTFGKSVRQIGVFNQLINRFSNLNPGQQNMARSNLLERATKQGLIDPRASTDFNISRLNALGGGNVASFLYPNQQTQNQAIRVSDRPQRRSRGGIIYASTGMLVPYEPRGTDTVPAMLTPGEFVINRAATQKHRPLLEAINRNKGGAVKYLADGGSSTDVTKYVDGVAIEPPPDKRIDNILANTSTSNDLARLNRDNIQTNTRKVPDNNRTAQGKLDLILKNLEECCSTLSARTNDILTLIADAKQDIINAMNLAIGGIAVALNMPGLLNQQQPVPPPPQGPQPGQPMGLFKGGVVYAADGTLVNYQPKGTDTVPAMLTPGEFVINKKATQQNLPLLQSINSGNYSAGGIVYAQKGMEIGDRFTTTLQEAMTRAGQAPYNPQSIANNRAMNNGPSSQSIFPELQTIGNDTLEQSLVRKVPITIGKVPGGYAGMNSGRTGGAQNIIMSPWTDFDKNKNNKLDSDELQEFWSIAAHETRHYLQRHTQSPKHIEDQRRLIRTNPDLQPLLKAAEQDNVKNIDYFYNSAEMDVRFGAMRGVVKKYIEDQKKLGKQENAPSNWREFMSLVGKSGNTTTDIVTGQDYYYSRLQSFVDKNLLDEAYVDSLYDQFFARAAIVLSKGGVVYAQGGGQMSLPDSPSRKTENYIPFRSLRDKQLAERKSAYEKTQQEKAVRSRLEQGARFYINQDEMERRRKEENSPEAAQERQQRAIDRSSRSNIGTGFGGAGIRYDKSGRPYAKGGVIYAQDGMKIPNGMAAYKAGMGPYSTNTPSPINTFDSEKLAEEAKAAGYGAAKSVLPGLAGLGAGVLGLPTTGPGGFAIGLGAGAAVYQAQENYLNALAPQTNKDVNDTMENNWQASLLGSLLGGFGADKIGRNLLSSSMKNTSGIRMLPSGNGSVRPDMKSAGQEALEEFSLRSRPAISAPLDVPKASKTVSLFHASNTGLEDSILKSFQKEGGKSGIAKGYGQGAGLYTYTSREAAEKHARSIIKGNMLTGADARGKPMIVKFDEALDPSKFDLDYELNAGYVTRWIHDNFDDVQRVLSDQKIPMLKGKGLNPVTGAKGIHTQVSTVQPGTLDALVQSSTGGQAPRRWIYDTTDAITREGEVLSRIMKALGKRNPEMVNKFKQGFFETMPAGSAIKYTGSDNLIPSNIDVLAKARGGVVYANNGMLVPYQPKGTDTVPAMLTPGEFVVNRKATQQNLSLLHSINSGHYNQGGRVKYLADGGGPQFFGDISMQFTIMGTLLTGLNQELTRFGGILQGFQQPVGRAQPAANNGNGVNNGIAGFVQKFDNFTQQLGKIVDKIPAQINLQMAPTRISVDITGAQFLQSLQPAIQSVIIGNISAAMNTWVENNFDGIAPPDFGNGS